METTTSNHEGLTDSFTVPLRPSMRKRIAAMANAEDRTDAAMARILLEESLARREAPEAEAP